MGLATVVLLFVTVLAGAIVLAEFASPGRMGAVRGATRLIAGHLLLALAALVVWIVYITAPSTGLAWVGLAVVTGVAAVGFLLWRRSLSPDPSAGGTAVRPVPNTLLLVHGAAAAVTIVCALAAAVGSGR